MNLLYRIGAADTTNTPENEPMSAPEYVRVPCSECQANVKVETADLGEWVTCPKCDQDFVAKDPNAPKPKPKARPVARSDDDRPRRGKGSGPANDFSFDRAAGEEDDEYDRPRRRGPRPGTCPSCGNRRSAKVSFTWWGGLIGPAIFGLVSCTRCRTQYMKSSGQKLGVLQIGLYSLVVCVIGVIVFFALQFAAR
ncbi:hypothetical protein R5W24_004921 [Gemmata sp. JC717]|uniref:hypothetical protein n=1 Tax=Gemmata algarum TaxID=2975278 RepID=UPI0021BA3CAD|nr:hypothetical protein [Gemmata algarum]MDY3555775.1 hypothetical protein [Gemmata algarum]